MPESRRYRIARLASSTAISPPINGRACNLRDDYWLYVAYHCATPTPQLVRVQDPFDKLLVRPFSKSQTVTRTITATVETGGVRISQQQINEAGEV